MSQQQQQTVRITTTETTTSTALVINSGYLKTPPGLLKVIQFVNITLCNFPSKLNFFGGLTNWSILVNLFASLKMCACLSDPWRYSTIKSSDSGMRLRWNRCLSFQWSPFVDLIGAFLLPDERHIFGVHEHFIDRLLDIVEYGRHHIENHLCKFDSINSSVDTDVHYAKMVISCALHTGIDLSFDCRFIAHCGIGCIVGCHPR